MGTALFRTRTSEFIVMLLRSSPAKICTVAVSALIVLGGAHIAVALPEHLAPAEKASQAGIYEIDVTDLPDTKEGQPSVAVNPRNPNNLVFVATVFPPSPGLEPVGECYLAYSNDKGTTWTRVPWPMGDRPKCGEPTVAVDAHGTFYLDNNQISSGLEANLLNHNVVSRSQDGGRTWAGPVTTPLLLSGAPTMRVDTASGKVYAVAGAKWEYPSAISVSADGGQTFSEPRVIPGPMPCITVAPGIPQSCGYPGRKIAVYGGTLASASQEPEKPVNFHVSRDDGQTWTNLMVTDSQGTAVPAGTGALVPTPSLHAAADPEPWVSADPSRRGRFAVMVPRGSTLEVYITPDAGQTWTGPSVIAATNAHRPSMDFGANGNLGIMWRTTTGDAFSVASFDHGRSFSAPLQVNHVSEPVGEAGPPGDRWSGIALANGYAYVTWSDGRNSSALDAVFTRVPLSLYHRATAK